MNYSVNRKCFCRFRTSVLNSTRLHFENIVKLAPKKVETIKVYLPIWQNRKQRLNRNGSIKLKNSYRFGISASNFTGFVRFYSVRQTFLLVNLWILRAFTDTLFRCYSVFISVFMKLEIEHPLFSVLSLPNFIYTYCKSSLLVKKLYTFPLNVYQIILENDNFYRCSLSYRSFSFTAHSI